MSFRQAAERCCVSQPSLSAQLAQLESVLGARLFERNRTRVLLTALGRELVERARQVLWEADNLAEAAKRAADPLAGTLRLGVIPTISPYLLPAITPALHRAFPRLTLAWLEDTTAALVRSLAAGALDAALVALEAEVGAVEHEVIARDAFVLATPLDHALGSKAAPVKPAELRDAGMLLLDDGHCFRDQVLAFCASTNPRELAFRATSLSTLAQMVAAGAGVTLLPELSLPTETRRAQLRVRRFAKPVPHRTLALVWRKGSPLVTALRKVAVAIRDAYPSQDAAAARRPTAAPTRTARPSRTRRKLLGVSPY